MKKTVAPKGKTAKKSFLKRFKDDNIPQNVNVREVQEAKLRSQGCYY